VHGYSLLRTQLNQDYFNDIFDVAKEFQIEIEGHR
jgi:glutamine synthetase